MGKIFQNVSNMNTICNKLVGLLEIQQGYTSLVFHHRNKMEDGKRKRKNGLLNVLQTRKKQEKSAACDLIGPIKNIIAAAIESCD